MNHEGVKKVGDAFGEAFEEIIVDWSLRYGFEADSPFQEFKMINDSVHMYLMEMV